jgi:hypothetical protein
VCLTVALLALVVASCGQQSIRDEAQQIVDDRQHVSAVETQTALLQQLAAAESTGTAVAAAATRTATTNQMATDLATPQPSATTPLTPASLGQAGGGDNSRVVADMTIQVVPPDQQGLCLLLDPGTVSIGAKLTGPKTDHTVSFLFSMYRGGDDQTYVASLSSIENDYTLPLTGGLYCYSLRNTTPVTKDMGLAQLTNLAEDVNLRIIWRPR